MDDSQWQGVQGYFFGPCFNLNPVPNKLLLSGSHRKEALGQHGHPERAHRSYGPIALDSQHPTGCLGILGKLGLEGFQALKFPFAAQLGEELHAQFLAV